MAKKAKKKQDDPTEGPDFGEFTLGHPDEEHLLARLWESAQKNTQFPGTAHLHMLATRPGTQTDAGAKYFHLDLNRRLLVILEKHDGRVTARRTLPLQEPALADLGPPALVPGPEEASFHREVFVAADLDIDDELRDWTMETIGERLPGLAAVAATLGIFRPGHQDAFMPPTPLLPANIARLGATLAGMRLRPGVVRALAEGWLDTGEASGMAFVMEPLDGEEWWLATRPFKRLAGPIGEWTGPWQQTTGEGPSRVPMALRALRWPLAAAEPFEVGTPTVLEPDEIEVLLGTLPPNQTMPGTAEEYAQFAGAGFERDVLANKGTHDPRVIVFRGRDWERWNLDGNLPTDLDDIVRNIVRRGTEPDAVVLVHFGIVPLDGGTAAKCLLSIAEHRGVRHTRAMDIRSDATGKVVATRFLRAGSEATDSDLWIGVEPVTVLETFQRPGGVGEA